MPRRNDIHRILIIGSGPIVIGQACEESGRRGDTATRRGGEDPDGGRGRAAEPPSQPRPLAPGPRTLE